MEISSLLEAQNAGHIEFDSEVRTADDGRIPVSQHDSSPANRNHEGVSSSSGGDVPHVQMIELKFPTLGAATFGTGAVTSSVVLIFFPLQASGADLNQIERATLTDRIRGALEQGEIKIGNTVVASSGGTRAKNAAELAGALLQAPILFFPIKGEELHSVEGIKSARAVISNLRHRVPSGSDMVVICECTDSSRLATGLTA